MRVYVPTWNVRLHAVNDWQGCSKCPKAKILWFCSNAKCLTLLKQHEVKREDRQAQLHVENARESK